MKYTHSYHDCTKWFKLNLTFKESTFVLGTENPTQFLWLGNLYFAEFLRNIFHLQNAMLPNYILIFSLLVYRRYVPWEKKIKVGHRWEDRHPNKPQKWVLLVIICPYDYFFGNRHVYLIYARQSLSWKKCVNIRTRHLWACWDCRSWYKIDYIPTWKKMVSKHLYIPLPLLPQRIVTEIHTKHCVFWGADNVLS